MPQIALFKVVVFGDIGRYMIDFTEKYLPNYYMRIAKGVDIRVKKLIVGKREIKLHVWVISSEERNNFLIPTCVRGVKAGLILYDVNRKSTFLSIDKWHQIIKKYGENCPVLLAGIIHGPERKRQVNFEEGEKLAESKGMEGFIEFNVHTGESINNIFETLTGLILHKEKGIISLKELFDSH